MNSESDRQEINQDKPYYINLSDNTTWFSEPEKTQIRFQAMFKMQSHFSLGDRGY